ncbi:FUSC family protein [bacterium]|nr:FUSC family protein [bacterium]MDC1221730.1 FUSC family protein [Salibacteraceae bacterium]
MKKDLSELSDQELIDETKKMKKASILSALTIGIMAGIIIFSVIKSTWGVFTLIPLFFIYRIVKSPSNKQELERLMKERGLN